MCDSLEFRHLRNLIAVAEEGNISRAARRIYLSQPSLSTQIKDLEEVLQVPLLVQDHKGVHTTPAAEVLIAGGRELLKLRDEGSPLALLRFNGKNKLYIEAVPLKTVMGDIEQFIMPLVLGVTAEGHWSRSWQASVGRRK
jgi:hypothetical protein